jgi:hypothetical protein
MRNHPFFYGLTADRYSNSLENRQWQTVVCKYKFVERKIVGLLPKKESNQRFLPASELFSG